MEMTEIEKEEIMNFLFIKEQEKLQIGIKIANKHLWGLSNFKRFIAQFLKTINNEDQWTFDYESYCLQLSDWKNEEWVHPSNWAVEYYQERWDTKKMNKSFKSLSTKAQDQ